MWTMFAPTATRVNSNTAASVNDRIQHQTLSNVARYTHNPSGIPRRLQELDQEWDVERALATGSSILTLTGLLIGYFASLPWLLLSVLVQLFFLQHAIQGWCPPLPLFRKFGLRTEREIQFERNQLAIVLRLRGS
jgi:hypothetical protein